MATSRHPWIVEDIDRLPPALAAQVRAKMGPAAEPRAEPSSAPAPPITRAPRAPRPRRSPDAPPAQPIPLPFARALAEREAVVALKRAVPLAGAVWAARCDSIRLVMRRGMLGRAALWTYMAEGRVHSGWVLRGHTRRWHVTLDAATGQVLEAEVKMGRR